MKIHTLNVFCLLLMVSLHAVAQPGDRTFSVVITDPSGFVNCESQAYRLYACKAAYPGRADPSLPREEARMPIPGSIEVTDTLRCRTLDAGYALLPFRNYYEAPSCLGTAVLMIIGPAGDTMLVSSMGSYSWRISRTGSEWELPYILPFRKGLHFLSDMISDKGLILLQQSQYRKYLLNYHQSVPGPYSPFLGKIEKLALNKRHYSGNETITVTLTGEALSDGSCGDRQLLWTLQRKTEKGWIVDRDNCCIQKDCGKGTTSARNDVYPVLVPAKKEGTPTDDANEIPTIHGTYRLVLYDAYHVPYWTEEFTIN